MELYHLVPFIMGYYTINKTNISDIDDPLFKSIADMKIPTSLLYTLAVLPFILLITKSDKFVYTEHISIALSYYVFSKSVMYILGQRAQEPLYHMGIATISVLMLLYINIIPKDRMIIGYAYIALLAYVTVGSRKSSADLIFFDILIAHVVFFYSKRLNVS